MRRSPVVRLVVTVLVVGVVADAWSWVVHNPGPPRAFALFLAVPVCVGCGLLLHWAWRKHPF